MIRIFTLTLLSLFAANSFAQDFVCNHKHTPFYGSSKASNERSDTIDILNYNINLDITDYSGHTISGWCEVDFESKMNGVNSLSLDLLQLNVDSVTAGGQQLTYSYNDTLLVIDLATTLNTNDASAVTVYYNGSPQGDPAGWGGWYWQGSYAYNLGVGFGANPHNYGRVWYPCFDNFVERATYDFTILTNGGKTSYANGYIANEQVVGVDSLLRTWRMDTLIPTYLSCIAVSNYTHVEQQYTSTVTSNTTPVYLIADPVDTNNMKSSFTNLFGAMEAFEVNYGPYLWNKVGFHLVPFNSGAMEHATSIAYPKSTANGSTAYETLMAHELSHHWWGNLVTCRTEGDMWINEGMASYSEKLFLEYIYGYAQYINEVKLNHKDVLHHAHINDNGFYAVHGVPTEITYGDHSYNKGADVAHTLRGYMGDADFFAGLQSFLAANHFADVDAYDFMNHLNSMPGVDVTDFFTDWIFNPGFPHFSVDSIQSTPNGSNYDVTVYVRQKLKAAPNYYSNVPLEVTFMGSDWTEQTESFTMSGQLANFQFTLPFEPSLAYLNGGDKISQAVTGDNIVVTSTGTKDLSYPMFRFNVNSITDSAFLRVEHHWAHPDDLGVNFMYEISQERYWSVEGFLPNDFDASPRIFFNGNNTLSGNLDTELTSLPGFHEDSLVVFYRPGPAHQWEVLPNININNLGSTTDGYGYVNLESLQLGEYTFGWKKSNVSVDENQSEKIFNIYPNPAQNLVNIDLSNLEGNEYLIQVFDMNGKLVASKTTVATQDFIDIQQLNQGQYLISVLNQGQFMGSKTLIKN